MHTSLVWEKRLNDLSCFVAPIGQQEDSAKKVNCTETTDNNKGTLPSLLREKINIGVLKKLVEAPDANLNFAPWAETK